MFRYVYRIRHQQAGLPMKFHSKIEIRVVIFVLYAICQKAACKYQKLKVEIEGVQILYLHAG